MGHSFFVTGTDTDVGKTIISAWLTQHLNLTYWKPLQSGSLFDDDTRTVQQLCPNSETLQPFYRLAAPLSPFAAAEKEGVCINTEALLNVVLPPRTLIEGAGGLYAPITANWTYLDWLEAKKFPTLVVARDHLGTINHTCLTLEALRRRNIPILGVVLNQGPTSQPHEDHAPRIQQLAGPVGVFKFSVLQPCTPATLARQYLQTPLREAIENVLR